MSWRRGRQRTVLAGIVARGDHHASVLLLAVSVELKSQFVSTLGRVFRQSPMDRVYFALQADRVLLAFKVDYSYFR